MDHSRKQRISALLTGVSLTVLAFGLGSIVFAVGGDIVSSLGIDVEKPTVQIILSSVLLQGVAFGAVVLGYFQIHQWVSESGIEYASLREFVLLRSPSLPDVLFSVAGYLAVFGIALSISVISQLFGVEPATNQILTTAKQQPVALLVLVALSYVVVAPGEELLFRGVIQLHLRDAFSPISAIVAASVLFAVSHVGSVSGPGTLSSLISVFGVALVLGGFYEYTDNLTVPILIHGTYNATQFALSYLTHA